MSTVSAASWTRPEQRTNHPAARMTRGDTEGDDYMWARPILETEADGAIIFTTRGESVGHNPMLERMWDVSARGTESIERFAVAIAGQLAQPRVFRLRVREIVAGEERYTVDRLRLADGRSYEWRARPFRVRGELKGQIWSFRDQASMRPVGAHPIDQRDEHVLECLLSATQGRDRETGAHARRIGLYSGVLARAMGWREQEIRRIEIAAAAHDVGKIGVADRILLKPGRLDDEEFEELKTHTTVGASIVGDTDSPLLAMARNIVLYHHERFDGTGYPHGLSRDDIPVEARIVAIADVYDALVHDRVYRDAMPEDEVIRRIQSDAGSHFDPKVVDIFLDHLHDFRRIRTEVRDEPGERRRIDLPLLEEE